MLDLSAASPSEMIQSAASEVLDAQSLRVRAVINDQVSIDSELFANGSATCSASGAFAIEVKRFGDADFIRADSGFWRYWGLAVSDAELNAGKWCQTFDRLNDLPGADWLSLEAVSSAILDQSGALSRRDERMTEEPPMVGVQTGDEATIWLANDGTFRPIEIVAERPVPARFQFSDWNQLEPPSRPRKFIAFAASRPRPFLAF